MKITIDEKILEKYDLSLEEFLFWYLCMRGYNIDDIKESLIKKNLASKDLFKDFNVILSDNQKDLVASILIDSSLSKDEKSDFRDIAEALRKVFPEGKKSGTSYYWRDSVAIIEQKLKTVKSKYNFNFTKEQAINAAKKYVESFNGDYGYMQLLKYFILKKDPKTGELKSDFMSYISNEDQTDLDNNLWQTHLV